MAPNTQIGKILLPYKVHDKEGHIPSENFKFNRSREFSEDFTSKDWLEFASRWLHLADYETMLNDINEFVAKNVTFLGQYHNGLRTPVARVEKDKFIIRTGDVIRQPLKRIRPKKNGE